jgi:hypothetical protein
MEYLKGYATQFPELKYDILKRLYSFMIEGSTIEDPTIPPSMVKTVSEVLEGEGETEGDMSETEDEQHESDDDNYSLIDYNSPLKGGEN